MIDKSFSNQPYFTLNSGYKMPMIGLGTWKLNDSKSIAKAIVENGYRAIDNAAHYKN